MSSVESLIGKAKQGDAFAINVLLSRYRNYMAILLATAGEYGGRLNARFDSSDVVQNTLIDAHRDFPNFNGNVEKEFLAWLRKILAFNLADLVREHHAEKRDVDRQVEFNDSLSQSSQRLERLLPQDRNQPRGFNSKQEVIVMLADTLAQLPKDYREVIVMRHLQKASFEDIAQKMGRTSAAVRMLWSRAVASLKLMNEEEDNGNNQPEGNLSEES